ncbi:MAG: oligosaccharide flippase family protein [Myxococcales bacterium]|nr:oligosaccharide flippase family protein [Myxococcales bacterium]
MLDGTLRKKINRGVAWTGAAQAIIGIADFISILVTLALFVSAEHWGIAMSAMLFYPVLDALADSGVASAVIQRDDHTPEKLSTVFWFNVMVSLGLFGVTLVGGPLYARAFGEPVLAGLIIAYGGKLVLQNAYQMPIALLRKEMRFNDVARMRIVAHLAESISRPIFAAFGATIWCATLAALVRVVVISVHAQVMHPFRPLRVFRPRLVADYIRFGLRNTGSQVLYYTYTNLDYLVVKAYFGNAALGMYQLAYTMVLEPVRSLANVVSDVALPTFARLRRHPESVSAQLGHFVRLNLITVLPFLVVLFCIAEDFLLLTNDKWTAAQLHIVAEAVKILCIVGLMRAVAFLGPPVLDGLGRPGLTLTYMVTAAVLLTSGFVGFAQLLSHAGPDDFLVVAWAWVACYPLAFLLLGVILSRVANISWRVVFWRNAGILLSCGVGVAAGLGAHYLLADAALPLRLGATFAAAVIGMGVPLVKWQGVTVANIKAALR